MQTPPIDAPFADKMAYYRTQHTSDGVNVTYQVGAQIIFSGLRCSVAASARSAGPPRHVRPMRGLRRWPRERQHVVLR